MILTLIGMSNSGKSTWAKRFSESGYRLFCCDDLIEEKLGAKLTDLGYAGIADVAKWIGQPYEERFPVNQAEYLRLETEVMNEILADLRVDLDEDVVIDTTGSVIYSGADICENLKEKSTIVFLDVPHSFEEEMFCNFIENPKPLCWADQFEMRSGESEFEALKKCYPRLLQSRRALYEKYADVAIPYEMRRKVGFSVEEFVDWVCRRQDVIVRPRSFCSGQAPAEAIQWENALTTGLLRSARNDRVRFYSTNKQSVPVSLSEAVLKGLAPDGGLYMPEFLPVLAPDFSRRCGRMSLREVGVEVLRLFVEREISDRDLKRLVSEALSFDAPLVKLGEGWHTLELFHGPTLSFKDFGARVMSRLVSYFNPGRQITVLVATSGDTGSAIASGFYNLPGVRVVILYPSGKVSRIQEQQLTTMGGNVTALEIQGTFDDCQRLVKDAFMDSDLRDLLALTSANSINIGRLLPQIIYYVYAIRPFLSSDGVLQRGLVISVPSGNFGNLTAGLMAKRLLGLSDVHFVAATNVNDVVPEYLATGNFRPRPSVLTLSNSMDVGNPSNFARMLALYEGSFPKMCAEITGFAFSDDDTRELLRDLHQEYGYVADPHGAVAYGGLKRFLDFHRDMDGVFLETAHPAKFQKIVEQALDREVDMPERLAVYLKRPKQSVILAADFKKFRSYLFEKVAV